MTNKGENTYVDWSDLYNRNFLFEIDGDRGRKDVIVSFEIIVREYCSDRVQRGWLTTSILLVHSSTVTIVPRQSTVEVRRVGD